VNAIRRSPLLVVMLGLISVAAGPPVAMRVDIEPVRSAGSDTLVELTVQIAPEDRARIGRSAWIQAELDRGERVLERVAQTVEVDRNGRARIELVWPAGEFDLRIDIASPGGEAEGIWMGKISIPRLEPEPTPVAPLTPPAAEPAPAAVPGAGAAVAAAPETPGSEPDRGAAGPSEQPVTAVEKPEAAASVAPDTAGWSGAGPGTVDLTLVVTERSRPVSGMTAERFRLRVDGADTAIDEFGDAGSVPLFLAVAVDLSTTMAPHLADMSRQLSRLALRTVGYRGGLALATADDDAELAVDWGGTVSDMAQKLARVGSSDEGDLVNLINTGLGALEDRRGRRFLVVVTDGGHSASKGEWRDAADRVEASGVPILVIGFRGETLEERTRRNLERFAASSGGRSFFLPDSGMAQMTLDYLAELIEGSYALRFRKASGTATSKIRVEVDTKGLEVLHPRAVR
jgi:hypothetical protein